MSFDLWSTISGFFGHLIPGNKAPADQMQAAIQEAGKILDSAEALVSQLQGIIAFLPPAAAGPASIFANAVHALDSYVDTLENPALDPPK